MTKKTSRNRPAKAKPSAIREPIPAQAPIDSADDREVLVRVRAIMEGASYQPADHDFAFLQSDQTRGPRLQLDYLKPELGLRSHGIGHTIVVFGSSRIPEPNAAKRRLAAVRERLASDPDNAELIRAVRVAQQVVANSRYYDVARDFAHRVGRGSERSHGDRVAVMTGGGPGIMEAANRGAFEVGARTIGLNISLPHEQYPNPYITPELCFQFHYFAVRKLHFLHRARALVAFPGGYGTFDELFETLTLIQTYKIAALPVVLVGREFWSRAVDFEFLVEQGVIAANDVELFEVVETAEEIHAHIANWHADKGRPLLD